MASVVLRIRFRYTPEAGPPAGSVRRGVVHVDLGDAAGPTIYVAPENVTDVGVNGWFILYPLGRVEHPDAWIFARRMVVVGDEEAWLWDAPIEDPVVDADKLLAVWEALKAQFPTRTWTLAELRSDSSPVATFIKGAWPDERPRRIERTGGTDEEPVFSDRGPDSRLTKLGVYRGIGVLRSER